MDLSEFWSFFQPLTGSPRLAKDLQDNNSTISFSQSKVSSIYKILLKVLSPSEDSIKTCLNSDQHENTVNDNNACDQSTNLSNTMNLNIDRFYLKTCRRFGSELDYINSYDAISDSIYSDDLNKLVFNIVYHNNLSLSALDTNDYEDSETYYQYHDDYQALQPTQQFTYNDYVKVRANNLLLARLGYKLTLTLNTDNDKPETWNPKVAKKIISVDYSPLSLVNSFQDDEPTRLPDFSLKVHSNPSPAKFVAICRKLRSLRKLFNNDKIVLMSSSFYDVASLNLILKYNQATDDWIIGYQDSEDVIYFFVVVHYMTSLFPVIESFPDRWRKDEVIDTLISLILIFNPDQIDLNFPDSVRHEQYVYIYLLKRYLE